MRRTTSKLKTVLGRVYRDIERKLAEQPNTVQAVFADEMALAKRLLAQKRQDPNKLYALHAPEVECIAKGKVSKRYEFGVTVSIATTNSSNLVAGAQARPGNPYDGHTRKDALSQVQRVTGTRPQRCYVDLGYRGHDVNDVAVFKARQKRGVTRSIRRELKRRNAIEAIIGHMKNDGLMHRNYLKGAHGDAIKVVTRVVLSELFVQSWPRNELRLARIHSVKSLRKPGVDVQSHCGIFDPQTAVLITQKERQAKAHLP